MTLMQWSTRACLATALLMSPAMCVAQARLGLDEAIAAALEAQPTLKAEAERVTAAAGRARQAGAWPNPEFQFSNENLRRGQTYGTDVDTLAVITQPLDVLGKRGRRVDAARRALDRTKTELELARRDLVRRVTLAYWVARGAQEQRDLLQASAENFQRIVDYHAARLSVGAIPEQDLLRVRLESEQLRIAAHLASLDATAARVALLTDMGRGPADNVVLTEPLDAMRTIPSLPAEQAVRQRSDVKVGRAAVTEAQANANLQDALARPDLGVLYGYKRTLLPDSPGGVNTGIAGIRVTLPLFDRNTGNRDAAAAETRRQQQLLADTELRARGDLERARQEYELRRQEVSDTLTPLREHATSIAGIARAAYEQGGVDLLRLLDAERSRLEAERAWVQGMVAYQQSAASLEFAQGATR